MAKLTKTQLKSIVKECLVEILSEGLVGANNQIQESKKVTAKPKPSPRRRNKPKPKKEVIPETIKGMTDDPLMQSIFADTARNTLQEQVEAERNPRVMANGNVSQDFANDNLGEMFGEAAGNWATLAFSEKKLPGQHK